MKIKINQSMEKVLVKRDSIEGIKAQAEEALPYLQSFLDEAIKAGIEINSRNCFSVASDPNGYLRNYFLEQVKVEDTLTSTGLQWTTREQVAEGAYNLHVSKYSAFIETGEKFARHIQKRSFHSNEFVKLISIENGKAILDSNAVMDLIEENSSYAISPEEINLWEKWQKLSNEIKSFNEMLENEYGFTPSLKVGRDYAVATVGVHNFGKWFMNDLAPEPTLFLTISRAIQK